MSDTLLAAIVGGIALVASTWLQRRPTKTQREIKDLAQTTVDQTEKVGNGFTKKVNVKLDALTKSSGALHKRLDQLSEVVVNFDGRITHLEEHDDHTTQDHSDQGPESDQAGPQGPGRRPGDSSVSDRDEQHRRGPDWP